MRIFHIMAGRGNGGAEGYAADMIAALHEAGIDQQAVLHPAQARGAALRQQGVPVLTEPLRWPLRWVRRRAVARAIAAFRPDIVHCWMRRAASLAPRLECPVIGWFGGYYDPGHFKRCSHFIGVTPDIVAHQQAKGVAPARSFFVPTFPVAAPPAAPLDRAALQTPAQATVLLTLSRLHPKKGLDVLLQALTDLPGCVLWLAGDGPLEAGLRRQAEKLALGKRVRFLGWRTDRGALLSAADICVLPSRYEPFGTVMLEAWSSGTPLVAAAAAGPAAFIKHEEDGLLVPVDDASALAQAIARLRVDSGLRDRLVAGGLRRYAAEFTSAAVRDKMLATYRSIMASASAAP